MRQLVLREQEPFSLKARMRECDLTLKQVAKATGMSVPTVSKWVNRRLTIETRFIIPLAKLLGVDPVAILEVAQRTRPYATYFGNRKQPADESAQS